MLPSQLEIFENSCGKYLSIGITGSGERPPYIPVPWQHTSTAFNMCLPTFYLEPSDLEDRALMHKLESCRVIGMYIFTPLADYSFIGRFPALRDIYICRGGGMIDVSFVNQLPDWSMFYLCDAVIPDISPLFPPPNPKKIQLHKVCLTNYRIGDYDIPGVPQPTIAELLIE